MKKSNLYYATVFRRRNPIQESLLSLFLTLSSWPRMLIETIIRKNFGERYFNFSGAIVLAAIMALCPLYFYDSIRRVSGGFTFIYYLTHFGSWYGYLVYFVYCALLRRNEIKRLPGVFDFKRFSLSTGNIDTQFLGFKVSGRTFSKREIATLIEPGFFFLIGLGGILTGQAIGIVLLVSSLLYSFSYQAAYANGDNFIMDMIDEKICNEELVNSFIDSESTCDWRGFDFYGRRPADPEARRRVAELFDEEASAVAF